MNIDVQGAQNQMQAQTIERILLEALHDEKVDARPAFADDEAIKAIDPVSVALIVGILNSKTAVLVAKAMIAAIPRVFSDEKNREVTFRAGLKNLNRTISGVSA